MLRTLIVLFCLCTAGFARAQSKQIVICFGDSLTEGHGAIPGNSYPDFLRKELSDAGYHLTLFNRGVSGDTTKDGLDRLPAILAAHPAIVVLEFGANDALRGQPVPGIEHNLETMITSLQRAHIRILLLGMDMPPNLGPDYVKQFDAIYPTLASKYKLPLLPFLLQGVYGVDSLMSPDYIHPNGAGYQKVAQNVRPLLEPMLKK